jgi:valyl-tRNA synthetase
MPFITEEIWQALPHDGEALMMRPYPMFDEALCFPREEADFESIMAAVRAVRGRRAEMNVPPSKKPSLTIVTDKPEVFEAGRVYLGRLAYAGELTITDKAPDDLSGLVAVVTGDARLYMPLSELVDAAKERERVEKEIEKAKADIERVQQKLSNEQFTSKAPEHVVNTEREKLQKFRALLDNLYESLKGC